MREVTIDGIRLLELDEVSAGLRLYKLLEPHIDDDFTGIVVPRGFITNGASVPPVIRKLISPTGVMFRAAVVHDYLYHSKIMPRKKADQVFRDIVYDDTHCWILSRTAYRLLRIYGGNFWDKAGRGIEQVELS